PNCRGARTPHLAKLNKKGKYLPQTHLQAINGINKASKYLANGNTQKGRASIGSAAKLAAKLNKLNDKLKKKLNEKRKKKKLKPIPFEKLTDQVAARAIKELGKYGGTPLGSFGSSFGMSPSLASFNDGKNSARDHDIGAYNKDGSGSSAVGNPKKDDFLDFSDDLNAARSSSSVEEEEFNMDEDTNMDDLLDDISQNSEGNIWDIISTRYKKSVFPKFIKK
ncbi:MAG: hypothetical protein OXB84_00540, partial [Halobacteriovoraceae bacterium]|nr:hypothetical protein [Halobacteriovoraceae bacterium]